VKYFKPGILPNIFGIVIWDVYLLTFRRHQRVEQKYHLKIGWRKRCVVSNSSFLPAEEDISSNTLNGAKDINDDQISFLIVLPTNKDLLGKGKTIPTIVYHCLS
jgi:hypothetical protein